MKRGTGQNQQHFVEHYKLEVPIIFIRDSTGGTKGNEQVPYVTSNYNQPRCFTNCHQKYWGTCTRKGRLALKYTTGDFTTWQNISLFN